MSGDRKRYEILPPGAQGNTTGLFAILDRRTGTVVEDLADIKSDTTVPVTFAIRDSAVSWVRGQIYLAEGGYGRP